MLLQPLDSGLGESVVREFRIHVKEMQRLIQRCFKENYVILLCGVSMAYISRFFPLAQFYLALRLPFFFFFFKKNNN